MLRPPGMGKDNIEVVLGFALPCALAQIRGF